MAAKQSAPPLAPAGNAPTTARTAPQLAIRRLVAAVLYVVAGICAGLAAASPWWTFSGTGVSVVSVSFYPGSSYSEIVGAHGAASFYTYASHTDLAGLANLYEGALALTLVVLILALVLGALAVMASFGGLVRLSRSNVMRNVSLLALLLALVSVIVVPILQPGLITGCASSGASICGAFWGSTNASGESTTWGGSGGWELAIAATVLLVAAWVVWRSSRHEVWGREPTTSTMPPEVPPGAA